MHLIQPSTDVGFKILVGAPLFFPLDGQTTGGVVVGTTEPSNLGDLREGSGRSWRKCRNILLKPTNHQVPHSLPLTET